MSKKEGENQYFFRGPFQFWRAVARSCMNHEIYTLISNYLPNSNIRDKDVSFSYAINLVR